MNENENYENVSRDSDPAAAAQPAAAPKSDYNRQFLFDLPPVAPAKPARRMAAKAAGMSIGSIVAISSLLSSGVATGVSIGVASLISRPAPIVVNNSADVSWVTGAAAVASPSVVTISVSSSSGSGSGSGVVLSADGYILTNTHVVTLDGETASPTIEVKTADNRVFMAKLVGTDPTNDLAVIKVAASIELTPIAWADSDRINVGQSVVAIGAPLGLEATVTSGIVSALNRTIQVSNSAAPNQDGGSGLQFFTGSGSAINLDVIQTDAAINPGNSGGALVNEKGELVGINVAIASTGGGASQPGSIGVGFAIPANLAKRIATEIMQTGTASHAMLGAMVRDAPNDENSANSFSIGAYIESLTPNGPGDMAGLKPGDIVIKFNGKDIPGSAELTSSVRSQAAGTKVTLTVKRGDQILEIPVTLGDAVNLNK